MTTPDAMNLTLSAFEGMRSVGMGRVDALAVIQNLTAVNFYKSMTTHSDHRVWQDVYYSEWQDVALYIKFQQAGEYFVISFRER